MDEARAALARSDEDFERATEAHEQAAEAAEMAEDALAAADDARADAQAREADARAARSSAEGEVNALHAEVQALARLVERDSSEQGGQVLDLVRVKSGYEKALGAALADDLRAPAIDGDAASGWATLPGYPQAQPLPDGGVVALTNYVTVPEVLARRMSQVGLIDPRRCAPPASRSETGPAVGVPGRRSVALGRVPRRGGRGRALDRRASPGAAEPLAGVETGPGRGLCPC